MKQRNLLIALLISVSFFSCKKEKQVEKPNDLQAFVEPDVIEFGFNLNDYFVKRDTIKNGDSFGAILQRNSIGVSKVHNIAEGAKESYDIRKLQIGKPYMLLCSKDSLQTPECFIYQPNSIDYIVIKFADSVVAYKESKPVTVVTKEASGTIMNSLSETMEAQELPYQLINDMSDIYAWTINFFKVQKGDKFKIIYKERFIEGDMSVGLESIEAAYFQHKGEDFYAFGFKTDSIQKGMTYFDEKSKSLKRAFLKSPIQFNSRISSRYNLNRRIAYYGYALRPHKGTDFAAGIGTPILATSNGTVIESTQKGGNGKYVKIKHNDTYSTQYLHMSKQAVKQGQYVKQGDIIGYVGMTGNTGGPHVCYRFWKNGEQVDPFKEKLPTSESIPDNLKEKYQQFIQPLRVQLDNIPYKDGKKHLFSSENLISQVD